MSARKRGTTLVEVLVVIVIFLVGILAIAQIFPGGFQVLQVTRLKLQADNLARAESERLKANPAGLPEMILPSYGLPDEAALASLSPGGNQLASDGTLSFGGTAIGPWMQFTGLNKFRRIVGEAHVISAPRQVGSNPAEFGSLVMPQHLPVDTTAPFLVTGGALARQTTLPPGNPRTADLYDAAADIDDGTAYLVGAESGAPALYLPSSDAPRAYRLSIYGTVSGPGGTREQYFRSVPVLVPATTPANERFPLVRVDVIAVLGEAGLVAVNFDSLRVTREYREVTAFSNEPYEFRRVGPGAYGVLVNPVAASAFVSHASGRRPLSVVLDYQVQDWRVLNEDVRLNSADRAQFQLSLGSLRTESLAGADGRRSAGIEPIETLPSQRPAASFLILIDLDTGGIVEEQANGVPLVSVNKPIGLVTLTDASPSQTGHQIRILLPDGTSRVFESSGRALRALYMARDEWAVAPLKAAAQYVSAPGLPTAGQYYIGGTNPGVGGVATRIYFRGFDDGQKVSISEVAYIDGGGNARRITGQDFVIENRVNDPLGLPSLDLREVDASATGFDFSTTNPVIGVKGASVTVRAVWNRGAFTLGADSAANANALDKWTRQFQRRAVMTQVQRSEVTR
jgi:hypothetical protein